MGTADVTSGSGPGGDDPIHACRAACLATVVRLLDAPTERGALVGLLLDVVDLAVAAEALVHRGSHLQVPACRTCALACEQAAEACREAGAEVDAALAASLVACESACEACAAACGAAVGP